MQGTEVRARFLIQRLPNGAVRVDDRASGLVGLFHVDGTPISGDLARSRSVATIGIAIRAARPV